MNFFEELKRRNVFKVAIAYIVVAWVLLQVIDLVLENINTPDWVMQVFMLGLAVGFPIAVIVAWAFELTPEGLKRDADVDRSRSIATKTGHKLNWYIIGFLAIAVAFLLFERTTQPENSSVTSSPNTAVVGKSIAVLPFVNMSADKENEYFSDGLSEELLNLLAKVDGLKVAARTSSFKFKGASAGITEIGEALGVATVLEGSVRKSGNTARITAQLIKVDDGFHLWSQTYDRKLDDIFVVQDEIAQAIVDALKLPLLGTDAKPVASSKSKSFEAFDLYLMGRNKARAVTETAFQQAIEYFKQSLAIDPEYAPAYSGLADAYIFLADYGGLPFAKALALAEQAVNKALALDPDLDAAIASAGLLLRNQNRWVDAEKRFLEALKINPNNVLALLYYRGLLNAGLRQREAMLVCNKAMDLDPLSDFVRSRHIQCLISLNKFTQAEQAIQVLIAENPENPSPYEAWGNLYQRQGKLSQSTPMFRTAHRLRPGDSYMAAQIVGNYLWLNDLASAEEWLNQAHQRGANSQHTEYARLRLLAYKGEWQASLAELDNILSLREYQTEQRVFRGNALEHLGRKAEAMAAYRKALADYDYQADQPLRWQQSLAAVFLAGLLNQENGAEEFSLLMAQLEQLLIENRKLTPNIELYLFEARVASLRQDQKATVTALQTAINAGFRGRYLLETDPILKQWLDTPKYMALLDQLAEIAGQQRQELEQSEPESSRRSGFF